MCRPDTEAEGGVCVQGKVTDLKLIKSKVHAWGLTAVKPIQAEQFVIEYTGELIRLSVNSMRERLDSDSDYRFRVDDQWVVDATTKVRTSTQLSLMLLTTAAVTGCAASPVLDTCIWA